MGYSKAFSRRSIIASASRLASPPAVSRIIAAYSDKISNGDLNMPTSFPFAQVHRSSSRSSNSRFIGSESPANRSQAVHPIASKATPSLTSAPGNPANSPLLRSGVATCAPPPTCPDRAEATAVPSQNLNRRMPTGAKAKRTALPVPPAGRSVQGISHSSPSSGSRYILPSGFGPRAHIRNGHI